MGGQAEAEDEGRGDVKVMDAPIRRIWASAVVELGCISSRKQIINAVM